MQKNSDTAYVNLKQSVWDVMADLDFVLVESEVDEIISRLLKPCWHEAMGKANPFIPNCEIDALFDNYDGVCAWINGND